MAQIKVVQFLGGSMPIGEIVAAEGMPTSEGLLQRISGSLVYVGSGTTESPHWQYDSHLRVASGSLSATNAWPTGTNCILYGHSSLAQSGAFLFNADRCSGHYYMNGGGTVSSIAR